jgi:hypothetical protein
MGATGSTVCQACQENSWLAMASAEALARSVTAPLGVESRLSHRHDVLGL